MQFTFTKLRMQNTQIGIIGMGWVGSSVALSILQRGLCHRLLVHDIRTEIAEGEAMDLNHGSSFFPTAETQACSIREMRDCQAIVVTAGRGGTPGESRLDLLRENLVIAQSIARELEGFKGMLIVVANPVDVLTYFYRQFTGLPPERVLGTGTMLDTARLREMIGRKISVDPKSIQADVVGEHGDSEVILWSKASVGSQPLRTWPGWCSKTEEEIAQDVRVAAQEIIKRKGATNHAIGLVAATLLKWLLRGDRRVVNISSVMHGAYGLQDVALSVPTLIGPQGVTRLLELQLPTHELEGLHRSAIVLQQAIASVQP
ncbi:MAG: L-lactate dehydrogenase [Bacteroidota bacterium]